MCTRVEGRTFPAGDPKLVDKGWRARNGAFRKPAKIYADVLHCTQFYIRREVLVSSAGSRGLAVARKWLMGKRGHRARR